MVKVEHLLKAKRDSKLGIVLGFQNTTQFEDDLGHIETFLNLGNRKNPDFMFNLSS